MPVSELLPDCECGCGRSVTLNVKGRPNKFLQGHNKGHFRPALERFWGYITKIDHCPLPGLKGGCWLWNSYARGTEFGGEYGRFNDGERLVEAHRYSFGIAKGVIPDGMDLDHLCRVTRCVNPDHLEPVTHQINMLRGTSFVAINAAKTHCIHGHDFTPGNTALIRGHHRDCRTCMRKRNQDYKARKRAA